MVIPIFKAGGSICRQKFTKKAFMAWVVSHLQEKVSSTFVLSGEHMVHGLVAGLDKATISMHCYVAASCSPAMPQSTVVRLMVWPPPKRPDQDITFCAVSGASTELIFCIHRDFDVRNNMYKPRRSVCECCRDISAWKSQVMKPTVLGDEANFWGAIAWDEANWVRMKPIPHLRRASEHNVWLYINNMITTILPLDPPLVVFWEAMVL